MNETQIDTLTTAIHRLADVVAATDDAPVPEVLNIREVGSFLGITAKTVRKMDRFGELPAPILIGARKKWRVEELRAWLAAGAPSRERWRIMRQDR